MEIKKSILYPGVKANHLTYIGDAEVGPRVNVGAGTITCNYDGVHKYKTVIEEGAFIGSNTSLVAPVTVGAGAYIGAGSTITNDVPPGKLGIGRARQVVKEWQGFRTGEIQEAEPLNASNLLRELKLLNLECDTEAVEKLVQIFLHRKITDVKIFREVASPENLTLVRRMCAMAGQEPSNFEVAANLANLAAAQRKSPP